MKTIRSLLGLVFFVTVFCLIAAFTYAETYPSKSIRVIVPFPPGGANDFMARIIGQKLNDNWGQSVVIENKGGAGGIVGSELAAKASPDGYTLLYTSSGAHVINPLLFTKLSYNPVKDFVPISVTIKQPLLLVAHPAVPANSVKELIDLIKSKPAGLNYASVGNGSPSHIAMEIFKKITGVTLVHIPYKGSGPALIDVMGGHMPIMFDTILSSSPHVKSGKLKAIATSTSDRLTAMPDLPTVAESGLPGFDVVAFHILLAPAGVSQEKIDKLNAEIARIMKMPDVIDRVSGQGAVIYGNKTPQQVSTFINEEIAKFSRVIKESNIRAD